MGEFRIFEHLDPALIKREIGEARASKSPAVWPSEASALRVDQSLFKLVGKCHLAAFYRMIGMPITNPADAISAWKWIIGRAVEAELTNQAKTAGVYVAEGVKIWVPDIALSMELDIVTLDPESGNTAQGIPFDPWIVEAKSFAGYFASKEIINEGRPKLENLMQISMYLLEVRNGRRLKEMIKATLANRAELDAKRAALAAKGIVFEHRNRCQVDLANLELMSDGPVKGKLVYVDRAEADRKEFTIEIFEDFDGSHYPMVDGVPFKVFTLESIYTRYKTLQNYWYAARAEAVRRLAAQKIKSPKTLALVLAPEDVSENMEPRVLTEAQKQAEAAYLDQLEAMVRSLPVEEFFPRPEYEWSYTPERIEVLRQAEQIGKTKYNDYKKGKVQRIGDWQCAYCSYRDHCLKRQKPELGYQIDDLMALLTDDSTEVDING